jgi:hypothetical protein
VGWRNAADMAAQRDVKATVLDLAGGHIADDVIVAGNPEVEEGQVSVLARTDGTYVVMWTQPRLPPSPAREVRAQVLDAQGQLDGESFVVSSASDGLDQQLPNGTALPGGGFVIAWVSGNPPTVNVFARVFDDQADPIGDDVAVSALVGKIAYGPHLATTEEGFVVGWQVERPNPPSARDPQPLVFRRFGETGASAGTEVVIADTTLSAFSVPVLAVLDSGFIGAAWEDCSELGDEAGSCGIRFRLFHPSGLPLGNSIIANTTTKDDQVTPTLRALAEDAFLLAFSDASLTPPGGPSDSDVRARALYPAFERHDGQVGARCEGAGDAACGQELVCQDDAGGVKLCHPACDGECPGGGTCVNNTFCSF